ncbi:hypothetical protein chiPu_0024409 [Chiloscyllium punctatum]|uniref:p53 transactivation domain-containing protein n=1 Tax=Chiloscyllium punctatum TaxID=137246 RepID=A0A401TBG1_CHIPU|nr:hypothetical protein [Chiloscyllium punctatum]
MSGRGRGRGSARWPLGSGESPAQRRRRRRERWVCGWPERERRRKRLRATPTAGRERETEEGARCGRVGVGVGEGLRLGPPARCLPLGSGVERRGRAPRARGGTMTESQLDEPLSQETFRELWNQLEVPSANVGLENVFPMLVSL